MKPIITSLFANPIMEVQLDLDLEELTKFSFLLQYKNQKGTTNTNRGGWQSDEIQDEKHKELDKLKKEIAHYLQIYHAESFEGMKFKENIKQGLANMWVNINENHHYNEWHIHPGCTLSGVFYIKHDSSAENGEILFKHPKFPYMTMMHWPQDLVEMPNAITSDEVPYLPSPNTLIIFPAWMEHKVSANLKKDCRISISFNSTLQPKDGKWISKKQ